MDGFQSPVGTIYPENTPVLADTSSKSMPGAERLGRRTRTREANLFENYKRKANVFILARP